MPKLLRLFPACLLFLNGVVYVWVGWLFLTDPVSWFEALGITLRDDLGLTDLRATYGGFFAGLGVFLLWSGWRQDWALPATLLLTLTYAGLLGARSWGILVDGQFTDLVLQIYIAEWVSLLLALLALFCLRHR